METSAYPKKGCLPACGSNSHADEQPVDHEAIKHCPDVAKDACVSQRNGVRQCGNRHEDGLDHEKGRIVSRPLVLGLFAVEEGLVHAVGVKRQEREHLVKRGLEVHLSHIE